MAGEQDAVTINAIVNPFEEIARPPRSAVRMCHHQAKTAVYMHKRQIHHREGAVC